VIVYYSTRYAGASYAFATTRKSAWIANSMTTDPMAGIELVVPHALTWGAIAKAHAPEYVSAVQSGQPKPLAESNGFPWDPEMWAAVCASNGGAVAAALSAWHDGRHAGSLSSGLHHARYASGAGFCTFNGLVLAAHAVLEAGAKRILILDLDAHAGGGTASMIGQDARIVHTDVAVCSFDGYRTPAGPSTDDLVGQADQYLPLIARRLAALDVLPLDLILYNAGMDPYEGDDVAGLTGITRAILASREHLVFEWATARRTPVAFVLAGGYSTNDPAPLVALHRLTLEAAKKTCRPVADSS
jgi:acetoin utilization deacetylase AcuC-like enzyme